MATTYSWSAFWVKGLLLLGAFVALGLLVDWATPHSVLRHALLPVELIVIAWWAERERRQRSALPSQR